RMSVSFRQREGPPPKQRAGVDQDARAAFDCPMARSRSDNLDRRRYPSSAQILLRAFSRAIFRPMAASKFSGEAAALSPVTMKPLRKVSAQTVIVVPGKMWYCSDTIVSSII